MRPNLCFNPFKEIKNVEPEKKDGIYGEML